MMFKNSCRLLCANFAEVWKLLVYHILSFALCVGLLAIFYKNYFDYSALASEKAGLNEVWETGTLYGASFANALTVIANYMVYFYNLCLRVM